MFGGMSRLGFAIGPIAGGFIAARLGLRAPFLLVSAFAVISIIVIALLLQGSKRIDRSRKKEEGLAVVETLRDNTPMLAKAGTGVLFAQAIRAGRSIIVPLYAADVLGLGPEAIGIIVSASWALDMLLFIPAGWIMDKFGRKYAIVPSFFIQAIGIALIPLTQGFEGLLLAAALIGIGNGMSSGAIMTIGSDWRRLKRVVNSWESGASLAIQAGWSRHSSSGSSPSNWRCSRLPSPCRAPA